MQIGVYKPFASRRQIPTRQEDIYSCLGTIVPCLQRSQRYRGTHQCLVPVRSVRSGTVLGESTFFLFSTRSKSVSFMTISPPLGRLRRTFSNDRSLGTHLSLLRWPPPCEVFFQHQRLRFDEVKFCVPKPTLYPFSNCQSGAAILEDHLSRISATPSRDHSSQASTPALPERLKGFFRIGSSLVGLNKG